MEDYLGRDASPFSEEFWKGLDEAVVETAREILTARKCLLPMLSTVFTALCPTEQAMKME